MTPTPTATAVESLQAKVAALEELLTVQEMVVAHQTQRLDEAIAERDAHVERLQRAETKLRRYADDLAQANDDVKAFAYIVSHDFRSPLINLKGFSSELRESLAQLEALLAPLGSHLDPEQSEQLARMLRADIPEVLGFIESSASRMDSMVNALLKLSRLGHREMSFERVNLNEAVERVLRGLSHQIQERGVRVAVGPLPQVVADPTAMDQVVGNLLTNAVNYLDPARPGEIQIGGTAGPDEVTFFVRDNGRGISKEDMPKVFAPFRRAGKQDVPGEGMGLAYVQAMVRRHGGSVRCESEFGVGTVFTVTISGRLGGGGSDERGAQSG